MNVALFIPCYVDQLYPDVAGASARLLERLGVRVVILDGTACCGQPLTNAGFVRAGDRPLERLEYVLEKVDRSARLDRIVVPSGSCTVHIRSHARPAIANRAAELCEFLHDDIGLAAVNALGATYERRVGVHIGCHALRGLGLAQPSEVQRPAVNKVRALLETVRGLTFAPLERPDECCGFGGTFSVTEPEISVAMGSDRLADYEAGGAEAIVSTDMSCIMHLSGIARAAGFGGRLPMLHVAQVLAAWP